MKYLLDTCVVSDFVRGEAGTLRRIKATPPVLLAISSITVLEIEYGLRVNPERADKLANPLSLFLERITTLDFDREDARAAAGLRVQLCQAGTASGAYDVLPAGCALRRGLVFVTANSGGVSRVPGLVLENWREA
jgi:tRNA(fMet)-specific endonuclease VapC